MDHMTDHMAILELILSGPFFSDYYIENDELWCDNSLVLYYVSKTSIRDIIEKIIKFEKKHSYKDGQYDTQKSIKDALGL